MRQTVLGVFDSYAEARSAQRSLSEAGIAQADIAIYSMSADAPAEKGPRVYAAESGDVRHHIPVFDQLERLFARLFKSGHYPPETEDYRELIRRGGAIASADVSETQVDLARDLMRRAGAADIEERASGWRKGSAVAGLDEPVVGMDRPTAAMDTPVAPIDKPAVTAAASRASVGDGFATRSYAAQGSTLDSSEPRTVGGMQQVTTKTAGMSQAASMENLQSLSGLPDAGVAAFPADPGTHAEKPVAEPVVSPTIPPALQPSSQTRTAWQTDESLTGTTGATRAERPLSTGFVGDPMLGASLDDDPYDDEFRKDYDTHYAGTGEPYDDYQRAYSHGATLGKDERYREQDWDAVEANARENWESRYPESGWERFKAAVRHGWDRVTGG
jgi:hypothetical protein